MRELESQFQAELKGGSIMSVKQRLQLQVSAVTKPEPFWAYTPETVDRLGPAGVSLQGGRVIPWDNLRIGRKVLIREVNVGGATTPFIIMQSLLKRRFF